MTTNTEMIGWFDLYAIGDEAKLTYRFRTPVGAGTPGFHEGRAHGENLNAVTYLLGRARGRSIDTLLVQAAETAGRKGWTLGTVDTDKRTKSAHGTLLAPVRA